MTEIGLDGREGSLYTERDLEAMRAELYPSIPPSERARYAEWERLWVQKRYRELPHGKAFKCPEEMLPIGIGSTYAVALKHPKVQSLRYQMQTSEQAQLLIHWQTTLRRCRYRTQYDAKMKHYLKTGEKDVVELIVRDESLIAFRDALPTEKPQDDEAVGLDSTYAEREHSGVSIHKIPPPPLEEPTEEKTDEEPWRFYINRWTASKQRGWKDVRISTPTMPGYALSENGLLLVLCNGVGEVWRLSDRKSLHRFGIVKGLVELASLTDDGHAAWVIGNTIYTWTCAAIVIDKQLISSIRVLPISGRVLAGTMNGQVYLIDSTASVIVSYRTFIDCVPVLSVDENLAQTIDSIDLGEDSTVFNTDRLTSSIRTKGPFVIFLLKTGMLRMCSTINNQLDVSIKPPKEATCKSSHVTPWYNQRGIWTNGETVGVLYPDGTVGAFTVAPPPTAKREGGGATVNTPMKKK